MTEIERSFNVADVKEIELRIAMGDLTLAAGSGDQILLRARVRSGDEADLETGVTGGVLTVKNRTDNGWVGRNAGRIDVVLAVPVDAAVAVSAKTGLGDINSDGVAGLAEAHSGKGDVRAVGGSSPLTVKTGKGDVVVRAWRGDLDATSGKGDVTISDLAGGLQLTIGAGDATVERWQAGGEVTHQLKTGLGDVMLGHVQAYGLDLTTGRGDCTARQLIVRSLHAKSGYGDVALEGDPLGGQWQVSTGKGDLSLALPATTAVRVEAATRHGHIRSDLPQVKVARPGPASMHGGRTIMVIGDEPRAEVQLETTKGDISVRAAGAAAAVTQPPTRVQVHAPQAASVAEPAQPAPALQPASGPGTALTVLESLARGEISVDEAEALLRALEIA